MRTLLRILLALAAAASLHAQEPAGPASAAADGAPVQVPSTLDRVTVYQGRALVERVVTLEADATGPRTVVVAPLPLGADASSLQSRVEAGSVVVQGLELRRRAGGALAGPERERLQEELARTRKERRALETRRKGVETATAALQAMLRGVAEGGPDPLGNLDPENRLRFFRDQAEKLDHDLAELDRGIAEIDLLLADLQAQLDAGRRAGVRDYQEVRVSVFFERPGPATLRLSYLVAGAWWTPTYDVRVSPELTDVQVGLVAQVGQDTGEDWTGAQLVLSTSSPSIGLDPPDLPRRWLNFGRSWGESPARLRALGYAGDEDSIRAGAGVAASEKLLTDAEDAYEAAPSVAVQDLGLTAQFVLPERKDIPSNGKPHRFAIREVPLEVRPERYVVPSLSEHAYLRAEVTLTDEAPLLPGVAKVFLGPDFLGEATMPLLRKGDKTTLNLGIDHNLTVVHEQLEDLRENPGRFSLSSTAHLVRSYRAELKLSAAARGSVTVVVEESLPIAQDDRISVKATRLAPAPLDGEEEQELRDERGLLRWRLTLQPGGEARVEWGYDVSFPYKLDPVVVEG